MNTQLVSSDERELLDLIDKLRNTDKIEKTIPLPQIVVVGQQSCGKSSVLHAISGIQFPISDGLCTQFPTEIVLRRESETSTKASIRMLGDVDDRRKRELKTFEKKWSNASPTDLKHIIADAKAVLGLTDGKGFSPESLILEVCGPHQEHLTLIDLPGFFISTKINQDPGDIALVNEIAHHYMSKERAIVLAVVSGKTDFENQKILEDLKYNIPVRSRTLGVITAADQIRGALLQKECVQLLQENTREFGFGWHILRNLTDEEVNDGMSDRDKLEQQFFERTNPWKSLDPSKFGNGSLKTRLSRILKSTIAQSLPEIQQEVEDKLSQIDTQLSRLGTSRTSPDDIQLYLCGSVQLFHEEVRLMLSASPPKFDYRDLKVEATLRASVQKQYKLFADEMFDRGRLWKCRDSAPELSTPELQAICRGDVPGTTAVLASGMVQLLIDDIKQHRGDELPNLVHHAWATTVFQRLSQRWKPIAQQHCNVIFQEVQERVMEAVEKIADPHTADKLLKIIVQPAVKKRKLALEKKLEELHKPYSRPGIQCLSRRYLRSIKSSDAKIQRSGTFEDQCLDILRSAEIYCDIACDIFTENVVSLGVENCLLDDLQDILNHRMIYSMNHEDLAVLGGESPEIIELRQQLSIEKERFEKARDQISPSLDSRKFHPSRRLQRSTNAAGSDASPSRFSIAVMKATPPATPQMSPGAVTDESLRALNSRSSSEGRSASPRTEPSSPSTDRFSSPRHSRSASSISSYQGSPKQRVMNASKMPKVLAKEDGGEGL